MACIVLPPPAPPAPAPPPVVVPPPPAPTSAPPAGGGFAPVVLDLANSMILGGGDNALTFSGIAIQSGRRVCGSSCTVHVVIQNTSNAASVKANIAVTTNSTALRVFPAGVQQVTVPKGTFSVPVFQVILNNDAFGTYTMTVDIGNGSPYEISLGFIGPCEIGAGA